MMEIVNKAHKSITVKERIGLTSYIMIENRKTMRVSAGACKRFGIKNTDRINFINEGHEWSFYLDKSKDGFSLIQKEGKSALLLCNVALIKMFINSTRLSAPVKFPLTLTNAKLRGRRIIKVETYKPYYTTEK